MTFYPTELEITLISWYSVVSCLSEEKDKEKREVRNKSKERRKGDGIRKDWREKEKTLCLK